MQVLFFFWYISWITAMEKLLEQKARLQNLEIILILSAIGFPMQRFL
jgi:hypothetical protein